ncbi:MAG: response regulator [Verrucomicrobia bacterium]|nr:response regulator [Verrucomicrobiota bacterium]
MTPSALPKILIADDEVYMRRLLEATFRKGGYQCILCQNGAEALREATALSPDLIVIDVMMPGQDGLATVDQLKQSESTRKIPVIVLSAKGHALTRVHAEQAGAALFLTKPFSPTQLLEEVRRILSTT